MTEVQAAALYGSQPADTDADECDHRTSVLVEDERWQGDWSDSAHIVCRAVRGALHYALPPSATAVEVSVLLADDAWVRRLNEQFRGRNERTNVLAFPLENRSLTTLAVDAGGRAPRKLIGDIAIAYETVLREAAEQHKTPEAHLAHLVVHGVLHLLGYDHENDEDFTEMSAGERAVLGKLGYGDPYSLPRTNRKKHS